MPSSRWRILIAPFVVALGGAALAACGSSSSPTQQPSGQGGSTADAAADGPVTCQGSETACQGTCTDTSTDPSNCGTCGKTCGAGEICAAGACALACYGGTSVCGSGDGGAAICADLQHDPAHCGTCDTACEAGLVCANGTCAVDCPQGSTNCGGVCVDTNTDNAHCGDCGTACEPGQACSNGTCALSCQQGLVKCNGTCVDPKTSNAFCGATTDCQGANAGTACAAGQVCSNGACGLTCQQGLTNCNGTCTNVTFDPNNCGSCGVICTDSACSNKQCIPLFSVTYNLVAANFTGSYGSACGGPDCTKSKPETISWTDTLPAGAVVGAVRVKLNWNENCNGAPGSTTLNGVASGPMSNPAGCTCGGGGIIPGTTKLTNASSYVVGGANHLVYTPPADLGLEGWAADGSGSLGTVTVQYF